MTAQRNLAGPRESRVPSTGARDNLTHAFGRHRAVGAETAHVVSQNLPDQSDTLVIPINLGGIRGAITARFIDFRPFNHAGRTSRVCQK